MKTTIYLLAYTLFFSLIISCNGNNAGKGATNSNDTIKLQTSVNANGADTEGTKAYTIPKELSYTKEREGFVYDKFYPIGWSDDGKFAYIVEPSSGSSGLYFFEIKIVDIVNNKQVWSWKPEVEEEGNLNSMWNSNKELFTQHLNEYKIVQFSDLELKPTEFSHKGNDYQILMDTKMETDSDYGIDFIKGISLSMKSPQIGNKIFFEQRIDPRDYVLSAFVPGLLISPHNDRVVVICQKESIGAAGPPNMVYFEIIGSNLSTGFSKESVN